MACLTRRVRASFRAVVGVGLWWGRDGLVVLSRGHEVEEDFLIWQRLVGCMFLGLYLGAVRLFLSTFPAMQLWQPMVDPEVFEAELVAAD